MVITLVHKTARTGKPTAQDSAVHTGITGSRGQTAGKVNRDAGPWGHIFIPRERERERERSGRVGHQPETIVTGKATSGQ